MTSVELIHAIAGLLAILCGSLLSALFGFFSFKSEEDAKAGYGLAAVLVFIAGLVCCYQIMFYPS